MKQKENKTKLLNNIAKECEDYSGLFLLKICKISSTSIQKIRMDCRPGRLLLGKNRIMIKGIESYCKKEKKTKLMELVPRLKNGVGIYFSNEKLDDVLKRLEVFKEEIYANAGDISRKTVSIPVGPILQENGACPTLIEPRLRKEGMKTVLKDGVVLNEEEFTVCVLGEVVSQNSANILRLLKIKASVFRIEVVAHYDGEDVSFFD